MGGNVCQITIPAGSDERVGGIRKLTIKHMGIKIIVSCVGGHDRGQMDVKRCSASWDITLDFTCLSSSSVCVCHWCGCLCLCLCACACVCLRETALKKHRDRAPSLGYCH